MERAGKAVKKAGKHFQGTVCYSLTQPRMGGPVYNVKYYVNKAKLLQDMGADSVCIKDQAGLISPYDEGTSHGTPYLYDRAIPLIFWGAGIEAGRVPGSARTVDIAPTLARRLGVAPPPGLDGHPLFD